MNNEQWRYIKIHLCWFPHVQQTPCIWTTNFSYFFHVHWTPRGEPVKLSRCLISPPQSVLEQLASSGNQHLVPAVDGILDTAKELTEASESRRGHLAPRGNETKAKKNK